MKYHGKDYDTLLSYGPNYSSRIVYIIMQLYAAIQFNYFMPECLFLKKNIKHSVELTFECFQPGSPSTIFSFLWTQRSGLGPLTVNFFHRTYKSAEVRSHIYNIHSGNGLNYTEFFPFSNIPVFPTYQFPI